jgi:feruloyl-CoA synthase
MADPAPVRIQPAETIIRRAPDGTVYATSPRQLGPYPEKLTARLDHWAAHEPDRLFLAQRGPDGEWRAITYGEARARVRALAQALIDRGLSGDRPLVILSGNSTRHALLALAAMYAGAPYAPIAPAYSLLAREYTTLKALWRSLTPGLVFVEEGRRFERALSSVAGEGHEIVSGAPASSLASTAFDALERTAPTGAVDTAHARVGGDTVAKILFTSGSTGAPKGVINTQRMLCANQEMLRTALPLLGDPPPVLCDWLPWNHTFGGNHNFGIVLYNGGTLYIDEGRPTPEGIETTVANLREIAPTAYFNVPRGYDLLAPRLRADAVLRERFFSRLEMLFCAAASLRQQVADDLVAAGRAAGRGRMPFVTGLGATESAPFALCAGDVPFTGGRVGVPAPGLELKVAPVGGRLEARLRGPSITPGYWREPALTAAAFDEEGFYRLGDAVGFVDPADPSQGFVFEGRLTEDFKLSTGTWVRVGALRGALLAQLGDLAADTVITGHDRDFVGALIFPGEAAGRLGPAALRSQVADRLTAFSEQHPGSSSAIRRALLLQEPPAIDAMELTDKGSVSQRAVLANRAALVEQLYAPAPSSPVITIDPQQRETS